MNFIDIIFVLYPATPKKPLSLDVILEGNKRGIRPTFLQMSNGYLLNRTLHGYMS